jgi:hypothetical protein
VPKIPDPASFQRPVPTSRRGAGTGEAAGVIADALVGVGAELRAAGERERVNRVNMARAQAANALLDHEIAVRTTAEAYERKIQAGEIHYGEARKRFDEEVGKIALPPIAELDPVGRENFDKGIKRNAFTGGTALERSVEAARKDDFKSQFVGNLDRLGKLAGMPDADIDKINAQAAEFAPLATAAGLPKAVVDKAVQDFRDKNWLNHAEARAMKSRNSLSAIRALEQDLTAADGFYANRLDIERRNVVLRSVGADRLRIETKIQHEQVRREARAERVLGQIDQHIASGVPATAEMWSNWQSLVKGTPAEQEFSSRVNDEREVQAVLRKPMSEQLAFVQQREAALDTEGGTVRDRANLSRLQNAVKANVKLLQEAPLLFNANRTGEEVTPLDFAALDDEARSGEIAEQVATRMASIEAMRKEYGADVPQRPLLPQEAQALSAQLEKSTPKQQAAMFATLASAIDDPQAYRSTMQQIAPDSPVRAIAGMLATRDRTLVTDTHWFREPDTVTSAKAAQTMLEGANLLDATKAQKGTDGKPKTGLFLPEDSSLQAEFQDKVGVAFAGRAGAADMAFQAVKAYYVGRAAQTGRLAADNKDIDSKLVLEAITATLGTVVDFNGNGEALAPWGMDEDTFETQVRAKLPAKLREADIGLRNAGESSYYVVQGRSFLHDANGKPIVIDLSK